MRVFYLFDVNDNFYNMYKEYPFKLYKMFEDIYLTSKYDKDLASGMYEQITYKYNKPFMNNYIKNKNKLDIYYYNKDNMHIISSRYDYSKLFVNTYYIKIKSNLNFTNFFRHINSYSSNIFVCDFDNNDYFWLEKVIKLDDKFQDNFIKQ